MYIDMDDFEMTWSRSDGVKHKADYDDLIRCYEKSEKYKWHDLRKNPDDLPPVETEVEVVCERRWKCGRRRIHTHGFYEDGTLLEIDSEWNWQDIDGEYDEEEDCYIVPEGWWEYRHYNPDEVYNNVIDDFVIAWRYIEPFEEDTSDNHV